LRVAAAPVHGPRATSQRARAGYIRDAADPASAAAELDKLARLNAQGALTVVDYW
jgi:hypothetical protein